MSIEQKDTIHLELELTDGDDGRSYDLIKNFQAYDLADPETAAEFVLRITIAVEQAKSRAKREEEEYNQQMDDEFGADRSEKFVN